MPFWMAFWANHFGAFFAHLRNQWLSRSAEVRSSEDAMGLIYGFVWKFRGILGSLIFLEPQVHLLKWPFHWRYPIVRPRKKTNYLGGVKQSIYGTEIVVTLVRKVCILEKSPSKSHFFGWNFAFPGAQSPACPVALWWSVVSRPRWSASRAQRMARAENSWENGEFMVIVWWFQGIL